MKCDVPHEGEVGVIGIDRKPSAYPDIVEIPILSSLTYQFSMMISVISWNTMALLRELIFLKVTFLEMNLEDLIVKEFI